MPDTSITVAEKEVAVQIGAYDADLFSGPPRRVKRPPIVLANQAGYDQFAISGRKGAPVMELRNGSVYRPGLHLKQQPFHVQRVD
jgi:hypothetical protein